MMDCADHRNIGVVFDHGTQFALMARAAQLVQDDAGDPDIGIEGLVAKNQWRHPTRHAACVDDEDHGCSEQFGERSVAVAAIQIESVVQSLVALDDCNVCVPDVRGKGRKNLLVLHEEKIEIVAGSPARKA